MMPIVWNGAEWLVMGCDPQTAAANAAQPMVNGYDIGDLLTEIDDQIGQQIERAAHRYMPVERAKQFRRETVKRLGDAAVKYDHASSDH